MLEQRRSLLPVGLMLAGLSLLLIFFLARMPAVDSGTTMNPVSTPTALATFTPEPLIPTASRPVVAGEAAATWQFSPPLEITPTSTVSSRTVDRQSPSPPSPAASVTATAFGYPDSDKRWLERFGTSGGIADAELAEDLGLLFGSFINWNIVLDPVDMPGKSFWQTIRLSQDGMLPSRQELSQAISANPGSIWMIGNEPDVIWQDNVTPERYAVLYEEAHRFIKTRDPEARIAVAPVAQSTPLRRTYLDQILTLYRARFGHEMPVDIWTVHAYILREQAGSWGVDIPPGLEQKVGELYEIADHDDITIFSRNLVDFRNWMAERGYGDRPLVVTEFGIVMPADYGFPEEARIRFMIDTLDFLSGTANELGLATDGGRLVQGWFWYSLYDTPDRYPSGNLLDRATGGLTGLGRTWKAYVERGLQDH